MNAAQFLRLENPAPTLLEIAKSCQRCGESFVWSGQLEPPVLGDACEILRSFRYKFIMPYGYKSIMSYCYKSMVLSGPGRRATQGRITTPRLRHSLGAQTVSSARQPVNHAYRLAGERALRSSVGCG